MSEYAKQMGVTYKTAYAWCKAGQLDAYQLPTGTIFVREPSATATGVALYARLLRRPERRHDVANAAPARLRGYQEVAETPEIAWGLNDERPKLRKRFTDARVGVLVDEHQDRLTRLGYCYIGMLLEYPGRRVDAVCPIDTGDDLVDDCVAVITRWAARIFGHRNARRRAAQIQACVTRCVEHAAAAAEEA